ncbi:protein TEX261 [Galleria mellonella]|uniref:Protein TEX261 n=1 Tax=Galleria mellonella TaxID=7137 RepID=A0A6J1W9M3_GALME|nr:protein TEX261 [Galleria mellonella]XP_052757186.1 protein TEX261 [Galleria mellonella]
MFFLYLMSILSLIVQVVFVTLAIAAGLYYLAELVEEYTVLAKSVISWTVFITASLHIGLVIFEDLPLHLNVLGLVQQTLHGLLLRQFPVVRVTSPTFVTSVMVLVAHHYFAFKFFGTVYFSFSEVLAYFTLCLWVVPFALFVSLSANDYVLPTTGTEKQPLLGDNNVVTDYLSRKSKRYSLLSFFSFAKESILPQRTKKAF